MSANETQVDDLDVETFEVTDAALAKVLEVRSEEDNPESTALRVAITGSNGPTIFPSKISKKHKLMIMFTE